ncbi:MAG: glycosyltransferase [Acidobacteriota bacterium]|nr:glycosyltransferase [Acidobacteriota bacterium]
MVSLPVSRKARPSAPHGIVLLIGDLEGGGAERQCYLLARGLREAHEDVTVVTENPAGRMLAEYSALGVPVEVLGSANGGVAGKLSRAARFVSKVAAVVERVGPSVLQAFLPRSNCAASLIRKTDGPVVIASHRYAGRATWSYDFGQALEAIACRRADVNLANSEGVADHLRRRLRLPARSIHVVPNGVEPLSDASCFSDRGRIRRELGLEEQEVALVKVANLWPYKGYQDLVAALARVRSAGVLVRSFFVGGDRGFGSELERRVIVNGLSDRVQFLGERNDVCRLLPAFDLYVSASRGEGMSNAIMEAMQHGLAVIGSRVAGTPDLLADGAAGILYEPGDVEDLAKSILELTGDPMRRRKIGVLARQRVGEEFGDRMMVARTLRVYSAASRERGRAELAAGFDAAARRIQAATESSPAAEAPS